MEKYSVDKENDPLEQAAAKMSKTAEVKPKHRVKALEEMNDRCSKNTGKRS